MTPKNVKVFLDTSVIIAAVLSSTGGARKLFYLAEAGKLSLVIGPAVLRECEEVVRRKSPHNLPLLAQLLATGPVQISRTPTRKHLDMARSMVAYPPDAYVLAEALGAGPEWFVTHDKEHFLKGRHKTNLPFQLGTPGDLIQAFKNDLSLP